MSIKIKSNLIKITRPEAEKVDRRKHYRFDRNEKTDLFDKEDFTKIIKSIDSYDLVAYPNLEPLYKAIALNSNVSRNEILLTSGGDQGVKMIFETFKTDSIINSNPNYAMYSVYAKMYGVKEKIYGYDKNLKIDIKNLISKIDHSTKLLIISNPGHNGLLLKKDDIIKVIKNALIHNCLVVIDEAYIDFTEEESLAGLIKKFSNLIVLRTMSKAYGIAALRVGYLLSQKENIKNLYKVKPVYEVSGLSSKIGTYLMNNQSIKNDYIKKINISKLFLIGFFEKYNIDYLQSDTNFIYFNINNRNDGLYKFLKEREIFIKKAPKVYPFSKYLRLTIGNKNQMKFFMEAVKLFLKKTLKQ